MNPAGLNSSEKESEIQVRHTNNLEHQELIQISKKPRYSHTKTTDVETAADIKKHIPSDSGKTTQKN